jgi:hypothetical protein
MISSRVKVNAQNDFGGLFAVCWFLFAGSWFLVAGCWSWLLAKL